MDTQKALKIAGKHLKSLKGHRFDLLTIAKPVSADAAVNLAKIVSKLSPILGNLIEFHAIQFLNEKEEFKPYGHWVRQDPGFPDAIFQGDIEPPPGFEIKAWFPLATEITARFKDSQKHFTHDETHVVLLAWLPDNLIFGEPKIVDVCVVSGKSVAEARDNHYHNPPDYLVIEPEDTSQRTRNLQQTNTNGYKWQGNDRKFRQAQRVVEGWGSKGRRFQPTRDYQVKLKELIAKFPYRLDTNFAKMDRIVHSGIEEFKSRVLNLEFEGNSILDWNKILYCGDEEDLKGELERRFEIRDPGGQKLPQ